MKQRLSDRTRLEHMREAADIVLAAHQQLEPGPLPDGDIRYYGLIKGVEIIGEAAYQLSREFRQQHPEVEWSKVIRLRHILVHDYHSISEAILLHIIKAHVPVLRSWVSNYLDTTPEV